MSLTKTYDFLTATDYSYDSDYIELAGGSAKLKLLDYPGQTYTQEYTSDTGFDYDSSLLEFADGKCQQLSQGPINSTGFANYNTDGDADLNWGDCSLIGTETGSAAVASNGLQLTGGGANGCYYTATGAINADRGAVLLRFIPNYTTNPSSNLTFFTIANSSGSNNNKLEFYIDTSSAVRMNSWTSAGVASGSGVPFGTLSTTTGVPLTIEFNWDFTTSTHRIFVNGTQQGATQATATDRSDDLTSITYFAVGGAYTEHVIDYLVFAKEPLHTENHTAPSEPPVYRYAEGCALSPTITLSGALDGMLISIEDITATGSSNMHFTIGRPSNGQYWYNTSTLAWEASAGTYATSNTAAELATYLPTFPLQPDTNDFNYCSFFPQSANTQEYIDEVSVEYTSQIYSANDDVISIASVQRIWIEGLESFTPTVVTSGSDLIKYIMVVSGTKTYWDGAAWSASNGTYAQSNTAAEITTNIATLATTRKQLGLDIFIHSADGTTSPSISNLVLVYNAALPDATTTRLIDFSGYIYDNDGPVASQEILIRPYRYGFNNPSDGSGGGVFHIYDWKTLATTVSDGFFSGQCYLQSTGNKWEIKIKKQSYYFELIDKDLNDLNELTLTLVEV